VKAGASTVPADGVQRPSVSPLLWVSAAAWLGAWAGTECALLAWRGTFAQAGLIGWAGVAACAAWGVIGRRSRWRLLIVAIGVGLLVSLLHAMWLVNGAARAEAAGPVAWDGVVSADPTVGAFGTTVDLRLDGGPASGAAVALSWPEGVSPPGFGRRVHVWARMRVADPAQAWAPSAFRRAAILSGKPWRVESLGWDGPVLGPVAHWREGSLARLASVGDRGSGLVASMVFADRSAAATPAVEDAKAAGVAWLVTLSGLHLAVLVVLADKLAALIGLGTRGRAGASLVVIVLLALICGGRIALLRAAIVAGCTVVARVMGRRRDVTAAIGFAVLALLAVDPSSAEDVGLLLGVLAVSGIALLGGWASAWLRPVLGRSVARLLGASIVAQIAVAPIAASLFGAIGLLGPVVLVVSLPFVEAAVVAAATAALLPTALAAPATGLMRLACVAADVSAAIWRWAASVPGAQVPVAGVAWWAWAAWAAAPALVWWRWPRPRRSARVRAVAVAAAALVAIAALAPGGGGPAIIVMDVGQGDAVLVRDGAHTLLVDTGPDPAALRRALARNGVHSLDGVVLTHPHADHIDGLAGLAGVTRPAWIGVPDVVDPAVEQLARECASRTGSVVRLHRDMTWRVGETTVRVLWPCGGERLLAANDTSVVLLLSRASPAAILMGDAEERAQRGAMDAFSGEVPIMKVAHHGSVNGALPETLAVWRPRVALISCGTGNPFGHPHRGALSALAGVGARVHRTDLEGDLAWSVDGVGVCDNRMVSAAAAPAVPRGERRWPQTISPTSSLSTSSTAPRSCCWSAPSRDFVSASRPSPTSTSTWRRSTAIRPPPTTSSMRPTRCRS
jgi:competence protein ComEC